MNGVDWFEGELIDEQDFFASYKVRLDDGRERWFYQIEAL